MTGRRLDLRLETVGETQRVVLGDCFDPTDKRARRCAEFCLDASRCARYMNHLLKDDTFSVSSGPNQIIVGEGPVPQTMSICFPAAILGHNFRKSGEACHANVCDWKTKFACPYEGSSLPPRHNDMSPSYDMCCDH